MFAFPMLYTPCYEIIGWTFLSLLCTTHAIMSNLFSSLFCHPLPLNPNSHFMPLKVSVHLVLILRHIHPVANFCSSDRLLPRIKESCTAASSLSVNITFTHIALTGYHIPLKSLSFLKYFWMVSLGQGLVAMQVGMFSGCSIHSLWSTLFSFRVLDRASMLAWSPI